MSLKDTISAALKGDETDDTSTDAALERVRQDQKRIEDIEAKGAALVKQLADTEAEMGRAALAGDDAKAAKLADTIKGLERQRTINAAARKAAADELHEAQVALHKLSNAGQLKTARRNTKAYLKTVEELNDHLQGFARTFAKCFDHMEKITLSLPVEPGGGMMLAPNEFMDALQTELWRVLPVHPVVPSKHPPLPGAKVPLFDGDPTKVKPLTEAVAEALNYIVSRVEAGPVAAPQPEAPKLQAAAPVQHDPDDALLRQPEPVMPTLDAAQIMAGVQPRKLEV